MLGTKKIISHILAAVKSHPSDWRSELTPHIEAYAVQYNFTYQYTSHIWLTVFDVLRELGVLSFNADYKFEVINPAECGLMPTLTEYPACDLNVYETQVHVGNSDSSSVVIHSTIPTSLVAKKLAALIVLTH
jgi:hypothetical protein